MTPHSILQNMYHFRESRSWEGEIPTAHQLRAQTIQFMLQNKKFYTEISYDNEGREIHPPMSLETFEALIKDQSRVNSYTDEEGWFIAANCRMLDIELHIIINIDSDVLVSGFGGPYQIINRCSQGLKKKFCVGLIKNPDGNGHYQFIFSHSEGAEIPFVAPTEIFSDTGN